LEAETVSRHARNVTPKREEVSERARRLVRRNTGVREKTMFL